MPKKLLTDDALHRSEVTANAAMNRSRGIAGVNSYAKDLGFDVLAFLRAKLQQGDAVDWLDVCCGTGKALIEAGRELAPVTTAARLTIQGVDLVDMFDTVSPALTYVRLQAVPVRDFTPQARFDLITCVHGLHYLGDKLGQIARFVSWLKPDGQFLANLDMASIRSEENQPLASPVSKLFRRAGISYNSRRKILTCTGPAALTTSWTYLGADDSAGPNYTGQPASDSYYRLQ
ncbi:MAG: class I SAM-dependent methyltransferase [Planctomycetia bacterium]|nr:class I SAM-dependent methyltransferase [Planctomycetia bacterium]